MQDNLIAIYGVGSYFDDSLPSDWEKNDIDLIIIVKSLDSIPKRHETDVRYEKIEKKGKEIWIGYTSLESLSNKELFEEQSYASYEWSLIELRSPENSIFLWGNDIRNHLPSIEELTFDFDDLLARGLYHLDKSYGFQDAEFENAKKSFTKAVFKMGFYACLFFNPNFRKTSIRTIMKNLKKLTIQGKIPPFLLEATKECILYRRGEEFQTDFNQLRDYFTLILFSLLAKGTLHRIMKYKSLKRYLSETYAGFRHLITLVDALKKRHDDKSNA